jgi:endonuclease III
MPRESKDAKRVRAGQIFEALQREYPDAHCELDFTNAFELLSATILSAQCTDKRVNMVTPVLFKRYPDPLRLSQAKLEDVERIIQSTGFYHNKAKALIGMAQALVKHFGSQVPPRMEDLVVLPGVGRKTANVVLGNVFNINEGIVVDTHVARLAQRMALTKETDPVKIEQALIPLFDREQWTLLSHLLIWHGRRVCDARKPQCSACVVADKCPSRAVE